MKELVALTDTTLEEIKVVVRDGGTQCSFKSWAVKLVMDAEFGQSFHPGALYKAHKRHVVEKNFTPPPPPKAIVRLPSKRRLA
jgi:hypothetical protein